MLQKLKKEAASRMSKAQVDEILAEKDEEIRDLRTEGENLSKQVMPFFKVLTLWQFFCFGTCL